MRLIKLLILKFFSHFGYSINKKYELPETNLLRKRFAEITDYEIELIKKMSKFYHDFRFKNVAFNPCFLLG